MPRNLKEKQYPRVTTEFENASLDELGKAMFAMSSELRERKSRTPEERKAAALRCAELLDRGGRKIYSDTWQASSPESLLRLGNPLADVYVQWMKSEFRHIRWIGMHRAVDRALGKDGPLWLGENNRSDETGYFPAIETDEGFAALMKALDAEVERREADPKRRRR